MGANSYVVVTCPAPPLVGRLHRPGGVRCHHAAAGRAQGAAGGGRRAADGGLHLGRVRGGVPQGRCLCTAAPGRHQGPPQGALAEQLPAAWVLLYCCTASWNGLGLPGSSMAGTGLVNGDGSIGTRKGCNETSSSKAASLDSAARLPTAQPGAHACRFWRSWRAGRACCRRARSCGQSCAAWARRCRSAQRALHCKPRAQQPLAVLADACIYNVHDVRVCGRRACGEEKKVVPVQLERPSTCRPAHCS